MLLAPGSLLIRPRRGGGFRPTSIRNCAVWLDGQDITNGSGQPADGATISTWTDKSGNGNNATGASNQPVYDADGINGKPCVSFDASGARLSIADAASLDYTRCQFYVIVQRTTDTGSGQVVFTKYGSGSPTRELQMLVESSTDKWQTLGSSTGSATDINCTPNQVATTGTPFLLDFHFNAAGACVMGVNNTTFASDTETSIANSTSPIFLGTTNAGASSLRGRIGEFIMFTRALTASEHRQMLLYLSEKWGITITTPNIDAVLKMIGQSNGQGRGAVSALPSSLAAAQTGVAIWNGSTWDDPLLAGSNNQGALSTEFGMEIPLAPLLKARWPNAGKIRYVKHTVGGTAMNIWQAGGSENTNAKAKAVGAMNNLRNAGTLAEIYAVLMAQGESDSDNPVAQANAYQGLFAAMVPDMRTYLSDRGYCSPTVRWITALTTIADTTTFPHQALVRAAQRAVMAATQNGVVMETSDATFNADLLHYDAAFQLILGPRAYSLL